jgi:hypothetical protein
MAAAAKPRKRRKKKDGNLIAVDFTRGGKKRVEKKPSLRSERIGGAAGPSENIKAIAELVRGAGCAFGKYADLLAASIDAAKKIANESSAFSSASVSELAVGIFGGHMECGARARQMAGDIDRAQRRSAAVRDGDDCEVRHMDGMQAIFDATRAARNSSFFEVHLSILACGINLAQHSVPSETASRRIASIAVTFYEGVFKLGKEKNSVARLG